MGKVEDVDIISKPIKTGGEQQEKSITEDLLKKPALSVTEAKNAHFWNLAFPAVRLIVLAFMFAFFGVIQSARAYTVIGSVFGAFIFSVAGVSFWVGCQGISEAYASVKEHFPEPVEAFAIHPELNTEGVAIVAKEL